MEKISVQEMLANFERQWPPEAVKKLKLKLFAKGLIDCPCPLCSSQDTTSSGCN